VEELQPATALKEDWGGRFHHPLLLTVYASVVCVDRLKKYE
jgi:hypothetical protein